jgi:hypothetical protein
MALWDDNGIAQRFESSARKSSLLGKRLTTAIVKVKEGLTGRKGGNPRQKALLQPPNSAVLTVSRRALLS